MSIKVSHIAYLIPSFFILGRFIGRRNQRIIATDELMNLKQDKIVSDNPLDTYIPKTIDIDSIINQSDDQFSLIIGDPDLKTFYDPTNDHTRVINVSIKSRVDNKTRNIDYKGVPLEYYIENIYNVNNKELSESLTSYIIDQIFLNSIDRTPNAQDRKVMAFLIQKEGIGIRRYPDSNMYLNNTFIYDIDNFRNRDGSPVNNISQAREGAGLLWVLMNRMIMRNKPPIDLLNAWNQGLATEIKDLISRGEAPDSWAVQFVNDFLNGEFPNEIGVRTGFIHHETQYRAGRNFPNWTLPLSEPTSYNGNSSEPIVIHGAIFRSGYPQSTDNKIKTFYDNVNLLVS
jgi:hypothetical protein